MLAKTSHEYELTLTFDDDTDLDGQVEDLLRDIHNEADLRYCFVEHDLREKGTDGNGDRPA